ncbi:hypothetical protein Emed_007452 [Eimeria media]
MLKAIFSSTTLLNVFAAAVRFRVQGLGEANDHPEYMLTAAAATTAAAAHATLPSHLQQQLQQQQEQQQQGLHRKLRCLMHAHASLQQQQLLQQMGWSYGQAVKSQSTRRHVKAKVAEDGQKAEADYAACDEGLLLLGLMLLLPPLVLLLLQQNARERNPCQPAAFNPTSSQSHPPETAEGPSFAAAPAGAASVAAAAAFAAAPAAVVVVVVAVAPAAVVALIGNDESYWLVEWLS